MTSGGTNPSSKGRFQFRLWQLMALVTVAAVALAIVRLIPFDAVQGIVGALLFGVIICLAAAPGYYLTYWISKNRWGALLGGVASIFVFFWILLPSTSTPRWAVRRMQCGNTLKSIGVALHSYHDEYHSLPPAYFCDEAGKPIHSWRVLLLPFLNDDLSEADKLYKQYDFNEPWNGPNNIKLAPAITALYQCPEETQANATGVSYVVVVGKGTMWPGRKSISFSDVKDGTSSTIMVVEVAGSNIVGSEPRDLDYEQFPLQLNSPLGGGISSLHGKTWHSDADTAHVLFGDGSTPLLRNDLNPTTLKLLLEIDDGMPIGDY